MLDVCDIGNDVNLKLAAVAERSGAKELRHASEQQFNQMSILQIRQEILREATRQREEEEKAKEELKRKARKTSELVPIYDIGGLPKGFIQDASRSATVNPQGFESAWEQAQIPHALAMLSQALNKDAFQQAVSSHEREKTEERWHERREREFREHWGDDSTQWRTKIMAIAGVAYSQALRESTQSSYQSGASAYEFVASQLNLYA